MAAMAVDGDSSAATSPLSSLPSSRQSSPLSELSDLGRTPSPPPELRWTDASGLPSPLSSQQTSMTGSPPPDGTESGASTDKEGPPPRKRRRISKERTTEYLDLRSDKVDPEQQGELDRLLHVLRKRQKIVVIAGAGISVSAGIPDFRSATGLFRSLKDEHKLKGSGKHLFDASVYKDDISTTSFHDMVSTMSELTKRAKPTAFHHMLATIAKEDRLLRLYSQNVDGIDISLEPLKTLVPLTKDEDGKWPRTVQLHGGLGKMVCSKCHNLSEFDASLFNGPTPPLCPQCEEMDDIRTLHQGKRSHGIGRLRPRMVLYNEHNPDDIAIGSVTREDLRRRPDAVIVVGTTLKVPGVRRIVREMCGVVRDRRDGEAIWINNDLPPVAKELEDCFDIIVRSPCDAVARLADMRKWDDPVDEDYADVSDEDASKANAKAGEVHVKTLSPSELMHAKLESLPTRDHLNNSFSPPPVDVTPKRERSSPEDWSPMTGHGRGIRPSSEDSGAGDNFTAIQELGLLTPTHTERPPPIHHHQVPSLMAKLNGKPVQKLSGKQGKQANSKPRNTKPGKPRAGPKSKTVPKSKKVPITHSGAGLNFRSTKADAAAPRCSTKKPSSSPSKLRKVVNASEPMQAVSPNMSPSKHARPCFPNLSKS